MTYPDGTVLSYRYDKQLHLTELERYHKDNKKLHITYQYAQEGRLFQKYHSDGYYTRWQYNVLNLPEELIHEDSMGILDKYCYTYDNMGNKIAVRKERKGLPEESENYDYRYDVLNRLTGVEKDGMLLRRYHYDSFGNRISMEDYKKGIQSACTYEALNRLIQEEIWENSSTFSGESELETQWS